MGRRLVVVGGGLIGCEVAATARSSGLEVTLVEADDVPMGRFLGAEVASALVGVHRDHGVRVRTGAVVNSVERAGARLCVRLQDGTELDADLVVVGLGTIPNVEWLRGAGLDLGDGVLCDADGRTSAPHVYAAGDVAAWPGAGPGGPVRGQHWTSARSQGTAIGATLAGVEPPPPSVPYVWSDQYDLRVQVFGDSLGADRAAVVWGSLEEGRFVAHLFREGHLTAVVGVGAARELRRHVGLLTPPVARPGTMVS